MAQKKMSQKDVVLAYFASKPGEDIPHAVSKREIEQIWFAQMGKMIEDPAKKIRELAASGQLLQVDSGVYRFNQLDPISRKAKFSEYSKNAVLAASNFQCNVCRVSISESSLHVIRRDVSLDANAANGLVLCDLHLLKQRLRMAVSGDKKALKLVFKLIESHLSCPDWADHGDNIADALIPCRAGLSVEDLVY
jgi:hypothetical protein